MQPDHLQWVVAMDQLRSVTLLDLWIYKTLELADCLLTFFANLGQHFDLYRIVFDHFGHL